MLHVPLGAVGCWWVRTGALQDLWALGTHGDVVPPGVGAGPSWGGGKWSRTTSQPREGPPGVRGTPGRQPVGSGWLRGVPSQGHAGWPGYPFVPVTRLPSQSPGAARNMQGGRGSCPLPKASMWGSGVGVLARVDPVRTGTHAGTHQEEVGAASTPGWAALGIWDQAQLPPGLPLAAPQASQSPQRSSLTSSQYSTGGCWWAPGAARPLPWHPGVLPARVGPWVPPPLEMSLLEQVPMKPLSSGLLQCHGVPGCLWGPPCTPEGQGCGTQPERPQVLALDPPSTLSPVMGKLRPLSEPQCPPVGSHPWVLLGLAQLLAPAATLELVARALGGQYIFGGGSGIPSSHHPHLLGTGTEKGEAEIRGRSGYTRQCQPGRRPPGVPQELRGRAPPAHALGFVSHLRASN